MRQGNRPEEIAKQEAQVSQAAAQLSDAQQQLKLRESAAAENARAVKRRRPQPGAKHRQVAGSCTWLLKTTSTEELKAGTWTAEIKVQAAEVASARAQMQQARADLERYTVRSPLDGQVLQVKIHARIFAGGSDGRRAHADWQQ